MKNLFLVVGRSSCGKDSIVAEVCKQLNKTQVLSYTTRPKRTGEGNTHIFITPDEVKKYEQEIVAYTKIGEIEYFATFSQLCNCDFYIIDPNGVKYLKEKIKNTDITLKIIYIYTDDEIKLQRAMKRGDNFEIYNKRVASEKEQFDNFEYELKFKNDKDILILNNKNFEESIKQVVEYVNICDLDLLIQSDKKLLYKEN